MKRLGLILSILVFGFLVCSASVAADDYTFDRGFWWKDGQRYTREKIDGGRWVIENGYRCWQPTYFYRYTVYLNPKDPDEAFLSKVGDVLRIDAKSKSDDVAYKNRKELIELLGIKKPPPQAPGYMPAVGLSAGGPSYYSSQKQVTTLSGPIDFSILLQQKARSTELAQKYGGDADKELTALVKDLYDIQSKAATLDKGLDRQVQMTETILRGLATLKIETKSEGTNPMPNNPPLANPAVGAAKAPPLQVIMANRSCLECHSGAKIEGGYDVTKHFELAPEKKLKVVQRLLLPANHPQHMPKGGASLPSEEINRFVE